MRIQLLAMASLAVMCVAGSSLAHTVKAGNLTLDDLHVRAPIAGRNVTAAYVKITNAGPEDRLVSVACDCAGKAELHEMKMDGAVMKMRALPEGLVLQSKQVTALAPGGNHIMLFDLKKAYKDGDEVQMELTFAKQGKVKAKFHVVKDPAQAGKGMKGMDGHDHH